jgi:hypothetical protein
MKRLMMLGAAALLVTGCNANYHSIYRPTKLENDGSQLIDAKQRAIIVWPAVTTTTTTQHFPGDTTNEQTQTTSETRGADGKVTQTATTTRNIAQTAPSTTSAVSNSTAISVCAEPSPDAFTVLASAGELSVSNPSGVSAAGSMATTESGASLSRRTTTILAQRDAYFRLCEARANGWIDDIDLMVGQRNNQLSLVGMLAIEQLTGAVAAPAVAIGGSSNATSASAIQAIASARTAEVQRNTDLKKRLDAATTDRDAKQTALDNHKLPDGADAAAQQVHATKKAELEKELEAAKKKVDALTVEVETSDKVLAYYNKALDTAASTGSSAASIPAVIVPQPDPKAQEAAAEAVVQIVSMMNSNDMGPTICLRYMRDRVGLAAAGHADCAEILKQYAAGLQAQVDAFSVRTKLREQLVAILQAIENPGDPTVYKEQVKPLLDALAALESGQTPILPGVSMFPS